ncbi:hypothetical protein OPV22_007887 [Ensete ventricosum]|uniref:YTH domain-containing family protein n=1 Tax=Ensete ventricosum TaxID=4639 RepID=A0AAV8PN22_ENSVE|nr:hypothetical protein OPV22_007887 [Ensete ventricosum]
MEAHTITLGHNRTIMEVSTYYNPYAQPYYDPQVQPYYYGGYENPLGTIGTYTQQVGIEDANAVGNVSGTYTQHIEGANVGNVGASYPINMYNPQDAYSEARPLVYNAINGYGADVGNVGASYPISMYNPQDAYSEARPLVYNAINGYGADVGNVGASYPISMYNPQDAYSEVRPQVYNAINGYGADVGNVGASYPISMYNPQDAYSEARPLVYNARNGYSADVGNVGASYPTSMYNPQDAYSEARPQVYNAINGYGADVGNVGASYPISMYNPQDAYSEARPLVYNARNEYGPYIPNGPSYPVTMPASRVGGYVQGVSYPSTGENNTIRERENASFDRSNGTRGFLRRQSRRSLANRSNNQVIQQHSVTESGGANCSLGVNHKLYNSPEFVTESARERTFLPHFLIFLGECKPVTNSRDTQEVKLEQGLEMLSILKTHKYKESILDAFAFYDKREAAIRRRTARQQETRTTTKNQISKRFVQVVKFKGETSNVWIPKEKTSSSNGADSSTTPKDVSKPGMVSEIKSS